VDIRISRIKSPSTAKVLAQRTLRKPAEIAENYSLAFWASKKTLWKFAAQQLR
jgi:hypothetical protein